MSEASERKRMREGLAGYSLMGATEVAEFLKVSPPVAREMIRDGDLPSVPVGKHRKVDPIDLAVHVLAGREEITPEEYWKKHGDATPELARRYFRSVRRFTAA